MCPNAIYGNKGEFFTKTAQSKLKSSDTVDRNVYHCQVADGTTGYSLNAPTVCDVVPWLLSHADLNFVRIKISTTCMLFDIFLCELVLRNHLHPYI